MILPSMSVSNLAVMREGEKRRREHGNDIIFFELNNQISRKMDRTTILKTESDLVDQNEKSQT